MKEKVQNETILPCPLVCKMEYYHKKIATKSIPECHYSPVILQMDPQQIATEGLLAVLVSVICPLQHIKSLEKSNLWKLVKSKMAAKMAAEIFYML